MINAKYLGVSRSSRLLTRRRRLTRRWARVWIIEPSSVWGNIRGIGETECICSVGVEIFRQRGWDTKVSPNKLTIPIYRFQVAHRPGHVFFLPCHDFEGSAVTGGYCYVSVTMSTWSPSPIITIIITPIWDAYSCLPHYQSPPFTRTFPQATPELILLRAHYHWHILCQCYSVIIGGYHLRLFTQHFNPQLCVSGYGHAWNDLLYLSHVYSMSQNFFVVYSSYNCLY